MAVSALLGHGYHSAVEILPILPDSEEAADALYVILDQHSHRLNPREQTEPRAGREIDGRVVLTADRDGNR